MGLSADQFDLLDVIVGELRDSGNDQVAIKQAGIAPLVLDRVTLLEELQVALQQARDYQAALQNLGGHKNKLL